MRYSIFIIFSAILFVLNAAELTAQIKYQRSIGFDGPGATQFTETGDDAVLDSAGNLYVVSWTTMPDTNGVLVFKMDIDGHLKWYRVITANDELNRSRCAYDFYNDELIVVSPLGDYPNESESIIYRFDTLGNILSTFKLTGLNGVISKIQIQNANEFIINGSCWSGTDIYSHAFIGWIKGNNTKRIITYNSFGTEIINDLQKVNGNLWIASGNTESNTINQISGLNMAIDSSGNILWQYANTTPFITGISRSILTHNKEIINIGATWYPDTLYSRGLALKTDTLGNIIWSRYYKSQQVNHQINMYDIVEDIDSNLLVCVGSTLYKCDRNDGTMLWNAGHVPNGWNRDDHRVLKLPGGDNLVVGRVYSESDVFIYRSDSLGNTGCFTGSSPIRFDSSLVLTQVTTNLQMRDTTAYVSLDTFSINMSSPPGIVDSTICYFITSVEEESSESQFEFTVYPNPFTDVVTINVNKDFDWAKYKVRLYNIMGKEVPIKTSTINKQSNSVEIYPLTAVAGIYLLSVNALNQEFRWNTKIIKF